jgi:plastocyanin
MLRAKLGFLAGLMLSALTIAAVACGGSGSESSSASDSQASPSVVEVRTKNLLFDKKELHVAAGQPVTIRLVNEDPSVVHNMAVYMKNDAKEKVFVGDIFPGVETREYKLSALKAGSYFFRCDAHPDSMTGVLHVN